MATLWIIIVQPSNIAFYRSGRKSIYFVSNNSLKKTTALIQSLHLLLVDLEQAHDSVQMTCSQSSDMLDTNI